MQRPSCSAEENRGGTQASGGRVAELETESPAARGSATATADEWDSMISPRRPPHKRKKLITSCQETVAEHADPDARTRWGLACADHGR